MKKTIDNKLQKYDVEANRIQQLKDINTQLYIADEFISKRYLSNLEYAEIVDFDISNYPGLAGMSWYKITKIVYEQGVFFPDQISTLYAALHGESRQVSFVIQKRKGIVNVYVGARDKDNKGYFHSGSLLEKGFHGVFPGLCFEQYPPSLDFNDSELAISTVSGVASLRNNDSDTFIQGLERVINATSEIKNFTAIIIADNISELEIANVISGYKSLYSQLLPISKAQYTYSMAIGKSESETITKGFSKTLNTTIGRTITNGTTTTTSDTHTDGTSSTHGTSNSYMIGGMVGGMAGPVMLGLNVGYNYGTNRQQGENHSDAHTDSNGRTYQDSNMKSEQRGEAINENKSNQIGNSTTETSSNQISVENKHISYMIDVLDKQIRRLEESVPYGLWNCCTYFIADSSTTAKNLANIYKGLMVGIDSGMQTMAVNTWSQQSINTKKMLPYLTNSLNPLFSYNGFNVTAGSIVNSKELSIHMSLPQTSIPGVLVREQATFGRHVQRKNINGESLSLTLGNIYHLDKKETLEVNVDVNDFAKHVFITGSTGSGKSNTIYTILNALPEDINYLVIEPAKGEYFHYLNNTKRKLNVYTSERRGGSLLKLNPFKFPSNIDIYEHIGKLVEIFNVCWPMYAAMPAVLKESIIRAYENCGWNLKQSYNPMQLYPSFKDVLHELKNVANFSEYSSDTKADYLGSLETRLTSLTNGINGVILVNSNDLNNEELFDSRSIIDLSCLDSDSRSLVMGLLTLKLYEYRKSQSKSGLPNKKLQHITVLEEAHNILPRTSKQQSQESSNLIGKSVEMISNAIAEMRTYGEGFMIVDQSPTSVDEASIKNTNTKIIMSLPDGDDRFIVGKSVGLNEAQIEEISMLPTGVGVVFQNNWSSAVLCKLPYQSPNNHINNVEQNVVQDEKYIYDLIEVYDAVICNEQIKDKLLSILSDANIRSALKYNILTDLKQENINLQNIISMLLIDIVGINVAKEIKHINQINKYTETLKLFIKRKLGLTNIADKELIKFADIYIKGICLLDNNLQFYKIWKEAYNGNRNVY